MIRVQLHEILAMVFGSGAVGVLSKLMFDLIRAKVNGKEVAYEGVNITLPSSKSGDKQDAFVTHSDCERGMDMVTKVLGAQTRETHSLLKDLKTTTEEGFKSMSKKVETIGDKVTQHEIDLQVLKRTG